MFINCPHCQALIATDPATDLPPPKCPRCAAGLRGKADAAGDAPPAIATQPDTATHATPADAEATPPAASALPQVEPLDARPAEEPDGAAGQARADLPTAIAAVISPIAALLKKPAPRTPAGESTQEPASAASAKPADTPASVASTEPVRTASTTPADKPASAPSSKPADEPASAVSNEPADAPATTPSTASATARADAPSTRPAEASAESPAEPETPPAALEPATPQATETVADEAATPPPSPATTDAAAVPAATVGPAPRPATATPSFARTGTAQHHGFDWKTASAAVALALLLVLQLLLAGRAQLADDARWRPLVSTLCSAFGCTLPPWREPAAFTVLARDVRPHPSLPGVLRVTATLRNDARWSQPWPRLRLTLSDVDGNPVAARDFAASEYLGARSSPQQIASGQVAAFAMDIVEPAPRSVAFDFELH